jgi:chaperonin GroEL (HSP60 family)
MSVKQVNQNAEVDERLAALITNANAIRAIASAVEGTIGPKGLDTMLVDRFGEVVITNDGVTILNLMEVNHPAARMLINAARAQQDEVGDGTTTTTIMAGVLVNSGLEQVIKGVPVARVIEGIRAGVKRVLAYLEEAAVPIATIDDPRLLQVALVAGREYRDIACLVVEAARLVGKEKLLEQNYHLAEAVLAQAAAANMVIQGLIINKETMNRDMPLEVKKAPVLVVDDALEPEAMEEEALATETGFQRYLTLREEFRTNLNKAIALGVKVVLVDRGVDDEAEEMLTDAGIMVIHRVSRKELVKAAEHTGARAIKRTGLRRPPAELAKCFGFAEAVLFDEKLAHVRIVGGSGKPMATILVGAATEEVVSERERIAKDAAASVQAAVRSGIVPGGGSIELAAARDVERVKAEMRGMAAYGIDCLIAALHKPFSQIVTNAGFNPLEKLGDVLVAQSEHKSPAYAINCDTGEVANMSSLGVIDPALVKTYALKTAAEVAEAILRIDTIIKMRENNSSQKMDLEQPFEKR